MLTLIKGRAGTGKTSFVIRDIKRRGDNGQTRLLFIVPEQYSHDAERQLCETCGDRFSLFAEVITFSRLSGRGLFVQDEIPPVPVDKGGQILILYNALKSVATELKVFGIKWMRAELLERLLDTIKELKSFGISSEKLIKAADAVSKPLGDKLCDLALILSAYNAFLHIRGNDSEDMLTLFADKIAKSTIEDISHIYFDGFSDFTGCELRVIGEFLKKNIDLTICLTCDDSDDGEAFSLPQTTEARLRELADRCGTEVRCEQPEMSDVAKAAELIFLEKNLFNYSQQSYDGRCDAITICVAATRYAECEQAAAAVLQRVRSGYRWRDIAVMARNWEDYTGLCESVFERYGIRFFTSGRTDVISKPPIALIEAVLDVAVLGWEYKPVFKYLKTGLAGLTQDECARLENYILKWGIRGSLWTGDWTLPPDVTLDVHGDREPNSADKRNAEEEVLEYINTLRRKVVGPITRLSGAIREDTAASVKIKALYYFLEEINLPAGLSEKAGRLENRGELRLAGEYLQIWDIIVNSLEQMIMILEDSPISLVEFRKLFLLVLSRCSVSVIPVSLDRTALGGMAMGRRRDLKCLIILGATDENMPLNSRAADTFSDTERLQLNKSNIGIPTGFVERLQREMNILYSTVTLPSHELVISYSADSNNRPSFIIDRITSMFGVDIIKPRQEEYMTMAEEPCFELALQYGNTNSSAAAEAAREYFCDFSPEASEALYASDVLLRSGRGTLSRDVVELLYGRTLMLSPGRVEDYYSCAYSLFLKSGLRLYPRTGERFDAPTAGIFIHKVLEGVSSEVKSTVGYKNAGEEMIRTLISQHTDKYISEEMHGFNGKDARFIYLFTRLEEDVKMIVEDLFSELRQSDFEPYGFEVSFQTTGGSENPAVSGCIDRVDVWHNDGKNYIRVVDYKTGKKSFSLSDVFYGKNMQMLIYLFALKNSNELSQSIMPHSGEIIPAGILYFPARNVIINAPRDAAEDKINKQREKELRRKGLVLKDPTVIEAMENGGIKKYLPVKIDSNGEFTGDSVMSSSEASLLSRHVERKLNEVRCCVLEGDIRCEPFKSPKENACTYCEFHPVCGFDEELGDRWRYHRNMKAADFWEEIIESDIE